MSAFLICDVAVKNGEKLQQYLRLSESTLDPYGGRFHVQTSEIEIIEGVWNPRAIVIAEFPSMQKAGEWYNSAAYAAALAVKPEALERNMIVAAGLQRT